MFFTKNEDESSPCQTLNIFRTKNPAREKVKVVVSDKHMAKDSVQVRAPTDSSPNMFVPCSENIQQRSKP